MTKDPPAFASGGLSKFGRMHRRPEGRRRVAGRLIGGGRELRIAAPRRDPRGNMRSSEAWNEISRIYHAALAIPAAGREAYMVPRHQPLGPRRGRRSPDRLVPLKCTRFPSLLGLSPSPASMIPAFTSSSLPSPRTSRPALYVVRVVLGFGFLCRLHDHHDAHCLLVGLRVVSRSAQSADGHIPARSRPSVCRLQSGGLSN